MGLSPNRKILLKVANRAEVDQVVVFPGPGNSQNQLLFIVLPRGPIFTRGGGGQNTSKIGPPGSILTGALKFYDSGWRVDYITTLIPLRILCKTSQLQINLGTVGIFGAV